MKKLFIIPLIVMVSMASSAMNHENEIAEESKPSSFQPEPLGDEWSKWLVGEWEGLSESDVGRGKLRTKIELALNGQFLIMTTEATTTKITDEQRQCFKETLHASDEEIERFQSSTFKELQIHTVDPNTGEVVAYLFDSMRCVATGKGKREGKKEITEWTWSAFAQGATSVSITERLNDNKFTVNHKYTLPNGNKMEGNAEFTRKKTRAEKKTPDDHSD